MDIYVVQTGDTIENIANSYGISVNKLISDNELTDPDHLVPGEVIVIVYPSQTYIVQPGDTLASIAASYNISINELLRNNPVLSARNYIIPGETLTISYNRTDKVYTLGYTNTFIDRNTLRKTLPYLTYLSIFNYRTVTNGELMGSSEDKDIIQMAKEYGVIPLMHISTLSVEGNVDLELTYQVLVNQEVQDRLFENVIKVIKANGYYGVNISAQFISTQNQSLFYDYTKNISDRLRKEGFISIITINPEVAMINNEISYKKIDYSQFTGLVDSFLFLQYKWGIDISPPSPVISVRNMNIFLDYAITQIEQDKIFTGIPTLGYIWEHPLEDGFFRSNSITVDSAINLARDVGAIIQFDEPSQTPYFLYVDTGNSNVQYIVWFVNAITINSVLKSLLEKGLSKIGIWNIMTYFPHLWLVINSQYKIVKFLPEF
jgi:spore germination protein